MVTIVKLIGVILIALGLSFAFKPHTLRRLIQFFCQGNNIYLVGLVRIILGIIFLISATQCRKTGIMITLGVVVLLAGVLVFIMGRERINKIAQQVINSSDIALRGLSLVLLILGALILYSA